MSFPFHLGGGNSAPDVGGNKTTIVIRTSGDKEER
jgi:hypothetical protein